MTDIHNNAPPHLVHSPVEEFQAWNDEEILAGVLNALLHSSGVPSDHIRAQVKQGCVILSGVVCENYESSLAEQAAAGAPGVKQVENNLTCEIDEVTHPRTVDNVGQSNRDDHSSSPNAEKALRSAD